MMIVELRISSVKTLIHCNHRSETLSSGGVLLITTQLTTNLQGDLLFMTSRKLQKITLYYETMHFCFTDM